MEKSTQTSDLTLNTSAHNTLGSCVGLKEAYLDREDEHKQNNGEDF